MRALALLLAVALPAAADCPPAGDRGDELDALIERLKSAPSAEAAQPAARALWDIWLDAPDAEAQALLDEGLARSSLQDLVGAIEIFDKLIAYCPDYAEGYNQRAFMNFLGARFDRALPDLERAIALNPRHIAARSGLALTLMSLGRRKEAQAVLREALEMNPWLPERRYLDEPDGADL